MAIAKKSKAKSGSKKKATGTSTLVKRYQQQKKKSSLSSNKVAKVAKRVAEKSDSLKQLPYIIAGLIIIANKNKLVQFYQDSNVQAVLGSSLPLPDKIRYLLTIIWSRISNDPSNLASNYQMMAAFANPRSYKPNFKDPVVLLNILGFLLNIQNERTRTDTRSLNDLLRRYQDCDKGNVNCTEKPNLSSSDKSIYAMLKVIRDAQVQLTPEQPTAPAEDTTPTV